MVVVFRSELLSKDIRHDAAVLVIFDFDGSVESEDHWYFFDTAASGDFQCYFLAGSQSCFNADNGKKLIAFDLVGFMSISLFKGKGQDAHADEVAPVDPLKTFGNDCFYAEKSAPFAARYRSNRGVRIRREDVARL